MFIKFSTIGHSFLGLLVHIFSPRQPQTFRMLNGLSKAALCPFFFHFGKRGSPLKILDTLLFCLINKHPWKTSQHTVQFHWQRCQLQPFFFLFFFFIKNCVWYTMQFTPLMPWWLLKWLGYWSVIKIEYRKSEFSFLLLHAIT